MTEATTSHLDALTAELRAGERAWAGLSLDRRRELLISLREATARHAAEWVRVACQIKGIPANSALSGEEWTSGPYAVLTAADALAQSVAALAAGRSPLDGFPMTKAVGDRLAVRVLPHGSADRMLLNGFSAEVWCQPGVSAPTLRQDAGLAQRDPSQTGGIGLVLGAGNIFSIAPLDALYELFAHNRVVLLKLNPITDPLLGVLEKVFASFIELGVLRIVTGGVEFGAAALAHPLIAHAHITGALASHDAIVFGPGTDGRDRKARGEALLGIPITSELGGVSPTIVVPGRWSQRDLAFQAEHIVTQKLHNNGYNCIAAQVLVLSGDWPQRAAFLDSLRAAYGAAARRPAYYPGSDGRLAAALAAHPEAGRFADGDRVLLTIPGDDDDPVYTEECFGPVLAVTTLPGGGAAFLASAIQFANARLAGTLGANIVIHPRTRRQLGAGFERALAELRYGTIGVNAWTAVGFLTARATWGAFPGHTLADAGSGIGIVHNALLLDHAERTVVRGPFRPFPRCLAAGELAFSPRPPWFVTNRTAGLTGARLTDFVAAPGWRKLPRLFAGALRG